MPVWKALFRTMWMAISSIFHIVLWPVVMHWRMFISEAKYLTSQGEERVKARIKRDDATIVSSRSQMIEVCSESSFQPLLQLYLFLPTLLVSFRTFSATVSFDQREKRHFLQCQQSSVLVNLDVLPQPILVFHGLPVAEEKGRFGLWCQSVGQDFPSVLQHLPDLLSTSCLCVAGLCMRRRKLLARLCLCPHPYPHHVLRPL